MYVLVIFEDERLQQTLEDFNNFSLSLERDKMVNLQFFQFNFLSLCLFLFLSVSVCRYILCVCMGVDILYW